MKFKGMKMNCKQGDLAVLVRSAYGNEGQITRCVRFVGDWLKTRKDRTTYIARDCWLIDPPVRRGINGPGTDIAPDSFLRPIRDGDGEDEMLRIAGLPVGEPATVT